MRNRGIRVEETSDRCRLVGYGYHPPRPHFTVLVGPNPKIRLCRKKIVPQWLGGVKALLLPMRNLDFDNPIVLQR